ncbi:hypothetical protein [Dokdonella sp.]
MNIDLRVAEKLIIILFLVTGLAKVYCRVSEPGWNSLTGSKFPAAARD